MLRTSLKRVWDPKIIRYFRPEDTRIVFSTFQRGYASSMTPEDFDIVIVGGGPVGLALACALTSKSASSSTHNSALRVALVEAADLSSVRNWNPEREGDGTFFSNRVSSITNASRRFIQDIGAWQYVDESRTRPIEEMQVWDGISDSRIEFLAPPTTAASVPVHEMARLTENLNLQRGLLRRLDEVRGRGSTLTILDKTKVASIVSDVNGSSSSLPSSPSLSTASVSFTGWPLLHLSTSQTIRARLLIGADGPNSPVRAYSQISSYGWSYNARAIVATLRHGQSGYTSFGTPRNHTTAYQRFLPTGPIAFLPLSSTRASLVWSTTPELAQALLDAGDEVLARMINAAFRLPDVSMRYLHRFILERWARATPTAVNTGRQADPKLARKQGFVSVEEIEGEIQWRERAHTIHPESALSSTLTLSTDPAHEARNEANVVLSSEATLYPPLVHAVQPGSAASFPLRMSHADNYLGTRTTLAGDAAHTVHPLAGQGLNLGLSDAASLASTILESASLGMDVGSPLALKRYPEERYLANHGMLSSTDKLWKLYGTAMGPVVWARSVGLEVTNEWTALKDAFMHFAGGSNDGAYMQRMTNKNEVKLSQRDYPGISLPGVEILAAALEGISGVMDGARTLISATTKQNKGRTQIENSTLRSTSTSASTGTGASSLGNTGTHA
ncbi:putative ubiquinone biosynthesis monooxygenase [Serendipita sp. 411]|nr:putative ubiquinone biosynthesis monooxygenase [Serendipita sp. 411]